MLTLPEWSDVYISGPMRGYENDNREAFDRASRLLIEHNYRAVNPVKISDSLIFSMKSLGQGEPQYSHFLRADMAALAQCHAIYMLKGWDHSTGANRELRWATDLSMPVFFES